jgi:ketosteroid isomerase-like protein
VRPVDDIEAIKQLKARYFRTMDTKDWRGMRAVFADDVVVDTTASGGSVIAGADDFMAFLEGTLGDIVTVHQGHMPEITVASGGTASGGTASGIWALEDRLLWPDGREMQGFGHYHETYEKHGGEWRIKTLTLTRLRTDVSGPPVA